MKTRPSASLARACMAMAGVLLLAATAQAHKLSPTGTAEERRLSDIRGSWLATLERSATGWGLKAFGDPVHEEITDRIYGCDGVLCNGDAPTRAPAAVLAGVRWNDDPPFRIGSGGAPRGCVKLYALLLSCSAVGAPALRGGPASKCLISSRFVNRRV